MPSVEIKQQGLERVIAALKRFATELRGHEKSVWLKKAADLMAERHTDAVGSGGHSGHGGPSWAGTHPKWVVLEGKDNSQPLWWTGYTASHIHGEVRGNRAVLVGPASMAELHHEPGQSSKTRTQRIPITRNPTRVLPDEYMAGIDSKMVNFTIQLIPREVLWIGNGEAGMAQYFAPVLDDIEASLMGAFA